MLSIFPIWTLDKRDGRVRTHFDKGIENELLLRRVVAVGRGMAIHATDGLRIRTVAIRFRHRRPWCLKAHYNDQHRVQEQSHSAARVLITVGEIGDRVDL